MKTPPSMRNTVNNCDDVIKVEVSDWCMLATIAKYRNIIGNRDLETADANLNIMM